MAGRRRHSVKAEIVVSLNNDLSKQNCEQPSNCLEIPYYQSASTGFRVFNIDVSIRGTVS
jgi:hypothetical protein